MKKLMFIILLSIFYSSFLSAQISLGVKGGINFSRINNLNFGSQNDKKRGIYMGLSSNTSLSEKFDIQSDLMYSQKGINLDIGNINIDYISLPILLSYKWNKKFSIQLGPELNYKILVTSTIHPYLNKDDLYNKFDFATDLGIAYHLTDKVGIEIRYSYGLNDLITIDFTDEDGNLIETKHFGNNQVVQLGVKYRFY